MADSGIPWCALVFLHNQKQLDGVQLMTPRHVREILSPPEKQYYTLNQVTDTVVQPSAGTDLTFHLLAWLRGLGKEAK